MMTLFSIIKVNAIETQDENEKATNIWKDIFKHHDMIQNINETTEEDQPIDYMDSDSMFLSQHSIDFPNYTEDNNSSSVTVFHRITSDNVTRHGMTTIPSSVVISLIETVVESVSGETTLVLAIAGVLPILMLAMPFVITLSFVPVIIFTVLTMTGVFTSTLLSMPLTLVGLALYAAMDFDLHDFVTDKVSNLPSLEEIEKIGEKISQAMEEEQPTMITNITVPRLFI